jgi:hypothetical protein
MKILIFTFFFVSNCIAQTAFNYLEHDIENTPDFFSRQFAEKENEIFREVLAFDTKHNNREYKIRTYSLMAPRFKPGIYLTCIYSKISDKWVCEHARAFPIRKSHSGQNITLGPQTYDMLLFLVASDWSNPSDPIVNPENFSITKNKTYWAAKPPWLIRQSNDRVYVYYSKLDQGSLSVIKHNINSSPEQVDLLVDNIFDEKNKYYQPLFDKKAVDRPVDNNNESNNRNPDNFNNEVKDIYGG